ncbi:hypothetical protein O181_041630 [Austropuccinia psidii MF-1]|uniref:Integrase catalytic domain-containing protein n=1 Tax=Austropuccinia psidii MF-1 TaxID=1389203 RepID=A0A9Q3DF78_9BASI|nr:hypothetical protein [Austropuccinia psidii MF-1]
MKAEKHSPPSAGNHHIELEGTLPPVGVIYSLLNQESEKLRASISENIEKGFIRPSSSSTGEPVLFVKKKDGSLCLCVDYHKLNSVTRKNKYPVPPINQLLIVFNRSTIFSKIDLRGAYNILRIKEGDEHLTALRTKYGSYAPASFQDLVKYIFADLLDIVFVVYLDDIMVFSSSEEEHFKHVASVFQRLRDHKIFSDLVDKIQKEVCQDKDYKEILKKIARGESVTDYSLEPQAKLLLFKDRVVIPRNEELQLNILKKYHDSPLAGHPGQEKTLNPIKREFYWAGMSQFIKDYVSSWQQCSRNKSIHHQKFGLLKPLQIPPGPCNYLSMDFITQLPLSNTFDSILAVVDRFSKMEIFIPTYGTFNALELAQILFSHVFSKHGLPVSIVSDRGSLFVSSFWTNLCQKRKISRDLSTAFHPETDGQTERVNNILEQSPWIYVSYHQDDLHTWFPLAEFAYNNAENSLTKQSPFFTIYGRSPSFDSIHIFQDSPSGKLSTKLQSVKQVVKEELE